MLASRNRSEEAEVEQEEENAFLPISKLEVKQFGCNLY
jgi:hypothetical protein